jgi:hypothetical protein
MKVCSCVGRCPGCANQPLPPSLRDFGMIKVGPELLLRPVPPAPLFTGELPDLPSRMVGWDFRRGVPRCRVKAGRA